MQSSFPPALFGSLESQLVKAKGVPSDQDHGLEEDVWVPPIQAPPGAIEEIRSCSSWLCMLARCAFKLRHFDSADAQLSLDEKYL